MDKTNYGSLPGILLAAVWGATDVVLRALEIMNGRKDALLRISREAVSKSLDQRSPLIDQMNNLLWSDYFLLSLGIVGFCVVFTILVLKVPRFFRRGEEIDGMTPLQKATINEVEGSMRRACQFVALFGVFGVLAFGIGGAIDIMALRKEIVRAAKVVDTAAARATGTSTSH